MKTNIARFGLISAAVLIGMSPAATVGTGTARAALSCDFEFTRSVPTVLPPQITGDGIAACDVPPDEHIVTLSLDYQEGGKWVSASTRPDSTIPPPYRAGGHSYTVSAACYAGRWRVSVGIRGKIQGHQFTYANASGTVEVPTSQCHPRF
ncbi:hypothetical protein [Nocardia brevicatena]|uniref:hypothetical protein n=1 Tax=Nocardia brevicatena TaxID=37327 RepID=UPI000593A538|nr:hypothetical protein [Nocardia brevicatena]